MKSKEKQTQENTKQTTLRIPMNIYEKIETLAVESERKVSDQIRFMLKRYIEIIERNDK